MFNYSPIAATASRLLGEFGSVAYVRVKAVSDSDPVEGTVRLRRAVDTAVNCIEQAINQSTAEGFTIEAGDKIVILDGAITLRDELVLNGTAWEVVNVLPVKPGSTGLVWKVQLRK